MIKWEAKWGQSGGDKGGQGPGDGAGNGEGAKALKSLPAHSPAFGDTTKKHAAKPKSPEQRLNSKN